MNMRLWNERFCGLAIVGLLATGASAAPGTWQNPAGGWEAVYDATGGDLPWELSGSGVAKTWTNQQPRVPATPGFTSTDPGVANYAGVLTDEITGQTAMYINTTGGGSAIAALQVPPGTGSNSDLLTIDFKFRLYSNLPASTPYASLPTTLPLLLEIVRPPSAAQLAANPSASEQFWQIRFRRQGLFVLGSNSLGTATTTNGVTQLGNQWRELRVLIDLNTGVADFYLDGSSTPDVAGIYSRVNVIATPAQVQNTIFFGTSSSAVSGVSSVEYIKVTSSELAPVIPEPASAALLLVAGVAAMARRRAAC